MKAIKPFQADLSRSLGAGIISAGLFLTLALGLPVFCNFSLFPLFYVGLREGLKQSMTSFTVAALVILLASGASLCIVYALFFGGPSLYMIFRALLRRQNESGGTEWYPSGLLVMQGFVCALWAMIALFAMMGENYVGDELNRFLETLQGAQSASPSPYKINSSHLELFVRILPALGGIGMFFSLVLNGGLAQRVLVAQKCNARPSPEIKTMEMPLWLWILLAISGALALFFSDSMTGIFSLNVVLVLCGAFMLQGISIVHVFCEGNPQGPFLLGAFYIFMLVFSWLVPLVIIVGVFEPWLNLRHKIRKNLRS